MHRSADGPEERQLANDEYYQALEDQLDIETQLADEWNDDPEHWRDDHE